MASYACMALQEFKTHAQSGGAWNKKERNIVYTCIKIYKKNIRFIRDINKRGTLSEI